MKVILLQDVENLGKRFDLKEVADGHARNFLIPKGLVKKATKEVFQWLEVQKEISARKAEEELKRIEEIASRIDDLEVVITVKVGEEGQLFESINAQRISDRFREMGFDIKKNQIQLESPMKELGEFPVKITFEHNLEARIRVIVTEGTDQ